MLIPWRAIGSFGRCTWRFWLLLELDLFVDITFQGSMDLGALNKPLLVGTDKPWKFVCHVVVSHSSKTLVKVFWELFGFRSSTYFVSVFSTRSVDWKKYTYCSEGEREPDDLPKMNSMELSKKSPWARGWISIVEPSRGIRSTKRCRWDSNPDNWETWDRLKTGWRSSRDLFHICPSVVKAPSPSNGPAGLRFEGALPNLSAWVAATVCIIKGSIVIQWFLPKNIVCNVFPYLANNSSSNASKFPAFVYFNFLARRSNPKNGSTWLYLTGEEHPASFLADQRSTFFQNQ